MEGYVNRGKGQGKWKVGYVFMFGGTPLHKRLSKVKCSGEKCSSDN